MKTKAKASPPTMSRVRLPVAEIPPTPVSPQGALVPHCAACLHRIELLDESTIILSGQWMPNRDLQEPIFVLDVDVPLKFVQLPTGQYALVSSPDGVIDKVVKHMHDDCLERIIAEVTGEYEFDGMDPDGERFR